MEQRVEQMSPRSQNGVFSHVCSRIAAAPIHTDPFPYCYVQDVFPSDFYQTLIDSLPLDENYKRYPPPYESRLFFDLKPQAANQLGVFWREFEAWINSQGFLDRMAEKFSAHLRGLYPHRRELVDANTTGDAVKIGCRTLLTRDYQGYSIGPHTDSPVKFLTGLFYLPRDERFASFGTSIYMPKEAGFTAWKSAHYEHAEFDLVRTFPNLPNSLFMFVKGDRSFHGVQPGNYPNSGRNLLMWIPEIGMSGRAWGPLKLPRSFLAE